MKQPIVAVVVVAVLAVACGDAGGPAATGGGDIAAPPDHGTWRELPLAPIGVRPYALAGWSGAEAVFWAGSNLRRDHAHTRGTAYRPSTDSWRELPVPGWGHPGLTGTVFAGDIYAAAKGGLARIDLGTGVDTRLPDPPGFIPVTIVATEGALWAVGPKNFSTGEPTGAGIARYLPEADAWAPGPDFEGAPELPDLLRDEFAAQPVLASASDIFVWHPDGQGLRFDAAAGTWQLLPPLVPPQGTVRGTEVAIAGSQLVALVATGTSYGVAAWDGVAWTWRNLVLELADFSAVSIAGAPGWILVFGPGHPPYTVDVATGEAVRHDEAPIAGVQAPNTVWTGEELVIWGGVPDRDETTREPPGGAVWVPPEAASS